MKKVLLFILALFTFIGVTNAEKCTVVTGSGKNIGDEIACGTEHFYVISNDGENVKMLAKYNLYYGKDYYLVEFSETFSDYSAASEYWKSNFGTEYSGYAYFSYNENNEYSGAYSYKYVETKNIKQEEFAIGAHGDESGKPEFPEIGLVDINYGGFADEESYSESYGGGYFYDYDLLIDGEFEYPLYNYNLYLKELGFNISNIDILTVSEIDDLIFNISGQNLPLAKWGEETEDVKMHTGIYIFGSIKEYVPEAYSWIWSTTYWTSTSSRDYESSLNYFVDTLGNLCGAGSCDAAIGAGIRPVVTMSAEDIVYTITTKTDGNGTITPSTETEHSGNEVTFIVTPNEGFELKEVKVTDANGNTITFTDYKFTMPDANVVIEAIFVAENPETSDILILACIAIIFLGITLTYINIKKMKDLI